MLTKARIRGEENEIPQNETEENHVVSWFSVNLYNGVNVVLPTVYEYNMFYNFLIMM